MTNPGCTLILFCVLAAPPQEPQKDEEAVKAALQSLVGAAEARNGEAFLRHFHCRGLLKEAKKSGVVPAGSILEELGRQAGLGIGLGHEVSTGEGFAWKDIQIQRISVHAARNEAQASARITNSGERPLVRFWLTYASTLAVENVFGGLRELPEVQKLLEDAKSPVD